MTEELVEAAKRARVRAYAPYSDFPVGCAVESEHGEIAVGANLENGCFRLGVCAEQSALSAAQISFGLEKVLRVVIVGGPRAVGAGATRQPVMPCGACRQAILEAANLSGRDIEVICCDHLGTERVITTISALLPSAFTFEKG